MAWLLDRLQYDPASIGVGDRALSNAAGSYLVHMHYDEGNKGGVSGEARKAALQAAAWPGLTAEADRLWALATSSTNLTAQTEVQTYDLGTQRTGSIGNIGIQNGSGEWIPGIDFTATLTEGAVFDTNGNGQVDEGETGTFNGKTSSSPVSLRWVAGPGAHDVQFKTEYPITWATLEALRAGTGVQDSLRRGADDPEVLGSTGVRFRAVGDFRPQGVSSAPAVVAAGQVLTDSFVPAAAEGDTWVVVDSAPVPVTYAWAVYDVGTVPVPNSDATPSGEPVFSGTAVASGPGVELHQVAGAAPASSTYVWVWSTSKALQPEASADYVRDEVWSDGTKTDETSIVRWQIEHASLTREYNIVPGGRVFDTITISGLPDDHGQFAGLDRFAADVPEATVSVYGPFESRPATVEIPEGAPVFWQDTLSAVNGVFMVGWDDENPIIAPTTATYEAGDYFVFVYSFAGDDRVEAYTSPANDLGETWFIAGNPDLPPVPETPGLVTEAAVYASDSGEPTSIPVAGDSTKDVIRPQDGSVFGSGSTAVSRLYFAPAGTDLVCSEDQLVHTSAPIALGDAEQYLTDAYTTAAGEAGRYGWVETGYRPDGSIFERGTCGEASETFDVVAVSTTLGHEDTNGDGLAGAGDKLWDDIHLVGTLPAGASVDLSSTVYELTANQATWGDAPINTGAGNITVAADVCTEAAVYTTLTVDGKVTKAGTYSTNRFTVPSAGQRVIGALTMVETAQITVGDESRTVTGQCGAPDESVGPVYFGSGGGGGGASAQQLAITGLSRMGLILAVGLVLAFTGGGLLRWSDQRKRRAVGELTA
ncbi:hypothetical protein [Cellulomonas sp. RIT-PI-Y]|uniref:hypothetical protein n=1 Tax=Cellulomonas sp. RIT-PI-Y TaxID=3035297 RepID=UPI0021DB4334|nr:hypothetical protein [Cellulomonas sp. RIT-PI-Y]